MEYILNETPLKTTNGFKINNIKVDLNIPERINVHDYKLNNINFNNNIKTNLKSDIGLTLNEYNDINIDIKDNGDLIEIIYEFKSDDSLIENININIFENIKRDIIFKYISLNDNTNFHLLNLNINSNINSESNITIINLLNDKSTDILSLNNILNDNSKLTLNIIDLGSNISIKKTNTDTLSNACFKLNNIYIGNNDNLIDLNYHAKNIGRKSINNIEVQGVLDDNAVKHFKGTIDFLSGCVEAEGKENENCVLLTDTCKSKSLPMLLCGEENVIGAHSVSSGKIDEEKLFYLMSRGLTKKESEKIIINSNFGKVLNEIPSEHYQEVLKEIIDTKF